MPLFSSPASGVRGGGPLRRTPTQAGGKPPLSRGRRAPLLSTSCAYNARGDGLLALASRSSCRGRS
eukprot:8984056-Pyramimonas_sp.AAC.1